MQKFSLVCSCGDPFSCEAENRDEAVAKMKAMMTQEVIDQHMTEKHPGQTMTMADAHAEIEKNLMAAVQ